MLAALKYSGHPRHVLTRFTCTVTDIFTLTILNIYWLSPIRSFIPNDTGEDATILH